MKHARVGIALSLFAFACSSSDDFLNPGADADPTGPDGSMVDPDASTDPVEKNIFDESKVWTYKLTLAPEQLAWLNENAILEEYVPASLEVDGETYPQAAVRYKGSFGTFYRCFDDNGVRTDRCDKLSMKLSFDEFDAEGRYHGVKKLNLHAMLSDPSKMHDAIGYKLFRDMGVPAPRTAFANVILNGENLGLFSVVENIDGRFTRANFPDGGEGNLYKEIWPQASSDAGDYAKHLTTNEGASVDRIMRFNDALLAEGDAGFRELMETWVEVDQLVGYFAVARLIDHWDDLATWYCYSDTGKCYNHNYSWYESAAEDKIYLIPWDLDHTFEEPSPLRSFYGMPDWDDVDASCEWVQMYGGSQGRAPSCDPFLRRIATQLWGEYVDASRALIEGPFSPEHTDARINELEVLLAPHIAADPFMSQGDWEWGLADLRDAANIKRAFIAAKL